MKDAMTILQTVNTVAAVLNSEQGQEVIKDVLAGGEKLAKGIGSIFGAFKKHAAPAAEPAPAAPAK